MTIRLKFTNPFHFLLSFHSVNLSRYLNRSSSLRLLPLRPRRPRKPCAPFQPGPLRAKPHAARSRNPLQKPPINRPIARSLVRTSIPPQGRLRGNQQPRCPACFPTSRSCRSVARSDDRGSVPNSSRAPTSTLRYSQTASAQDCCKGLGHMVSNSSDLARTRFRGGWEIGARTGNQVVFGKGVPIQP